MQSAALDARPLIVAVAGPNGAGRTTFHHVFLSATGLRFVNVDDISATLGVDAYDAAKVAGAIRHELVAQRESFIFETVFSDPVGEKVEFLADAMAAGYTAVLCFVGIGGPAVSSERVSMRASQGGHDVPDEKLVSRYPRTLANLSRALRTLDVVMVFDNDDLTTPYRRVATFERGKPVFLAKAIPEWLAPMP